MDAEANLVLTDAVLLLGAALVFVMLFRKLGLGAVLGYLVAGALIGPQGLGLVGEGEQKMAFAEIGIVLLLFLVGLELNLSRLWRLKRFIFGFGFAQVIFCAIALFVLIVLTTTFTAQAAIALALPLALSSTAQVLPGLKNSGRINSPLGEKAFSILLFQDLSIVPMITVVAVLSRAPADHSTPGWLLALYTVGAIVGLVLAGKFLLNPLLKLVGKLGERELFVLVGLLTVLASAALMHALHLSPALGAFVAGVMLADSPYRHEIEADVEPFRSILLGLFFLAVGMVLDVQAILDNPLFVIAMAAALVAVKTGVIYGLARLWKTEHKQALALALLLSQGGEFGFLLFTEAREALLIADVAASVFGAVVTLSMASTPFLMLFARRLELASPDDGDADLIDPSEAQRGTAIVIGHGRFGQTVAQMLNAADVPVTLIDKEPRQIELSGEFDTRVYYGDGLRLDLLERAGAKKAKIIAFCTDGQALDRKALAKICDAFPDAQVLVRAYDRRHLIALEGAGQAGSVREMMAGSIEMGRLALHELEISPDEIDDIEAAFRQHDQSRLDAQIEAGDLHAGKEHRFDPVEAGGAAK